MTAEGNARINLAWNAASGAASYRVKRSTTGSAPYFIIAENHSGTTFSDSGLPPGTAYHYIVSALGTGGESAGRKNAAVANRHLGTRYRVHFPKRKIVLL